MTSIQYKILLTPEQRERKSIVEERIDEKGLIVRYRVDDQTIFDKMFIADLIDRSQHDAGHRFLTVIEIAGAFPASCNLEGHSSTPMYRVGDIIGQRRTAFSSAYQIIVRDCGEGHADQFIHITGKLYRDVDLSDRSVIHRLSRIVYRPLEALAKYFRTDRRRDPREVIKKKREVNG